MDRHGLGNRFRLVKGASSPDAPKWEQTFPDSRGRNDRNSNARGDVPLYMLNTNIFKDALDAAIKRTQPGPNYMHVPRWIDEDFWKEIAAEERDPKKRRWTNESNRPNHATDLDVYARAGAVILGIERINWQSPPVFCGPESRDRPTPARPSRGRGVRDGGVEL
jgi:phage terminase large subunit GpA-like protein